MRFVADDLIDRIQALDLPSVAQLYLYKSMLKTKWMSAASTFPSYILPKIEASRKPPDVASCNVQARLFKTNAVKTTMEEVMNGVGSLLGVSIGTVFGKKGRLRASDIRRVGDLAKNDDAAAGGIKEDNPRKEQNIPQIDDMSLPRNADRLKSARSDRGGDTYASRLGGSSDGVSTETDQGQESLKDKLMINHKRSRTGSFSSFSSSCSTSPSIPTHPNPERYHISATVPKSTAFLPSITLGGYISDSNSDYSSAAEALEAPEARKNRRGQQARRQIWEKKYGKNAKHLQRQARSQDRDRDWDPRAGARPADNNYRGKGKKGHDPIQRDRAEPLSTGANADPVKARPSKAESKGKQAAGRLHPSWEAAKRAKAATKSVVFQGKKLVFE